MSGFCTHCGHRVDSFDGLSACPACGTRGLPCDDKDQVTVSVNWHELRILVIWAEGYARKGNPSEDMETVVAAIARRLEDQHPDRALRVPLTLAGELRQLADRFPGTQVVGDDKLQQAMEQHKRINEPPDDAARETTE